MKPVKTLKNHARLFADCQRGVAYIEFAIVIPVLLILFFGAIEITRYVLIVQKVEKTVDTLTDVLTQSASGNVATSDITQYLNATQNLMNPYSFNTNGIIILTGVIPPATAPIISWQVCGGGTLAAVSKLGKIVGGPANVAQVGLVMNSQDSEIVVGEVFYNYTPILTQNVVGAAQVYRYSVFKPRFGSFTVTSGGC